MKNKIRPGGRPAAFGHDIIRPDNSSNGVNLIGIRMKKNVIFYGMIVKEENGNREQWVWDDDVRYQELIIAYD